MRQFAGSPVAMLSGLVFSALLAAAALGDLRTRRIPNRLVVVLALLGMIYSLSRQPDLSGLVNGFGGLLAGLACWLPFYALGWVGAGDVKLFAAAGAWLGPARAVDGALVGALAGAMLSLIWMIRYHGVKATATTLGMAAANPEILASRGAPGRPAMPYSFAIASGAIIAGWMPRLLFS